MQDPSKLELKRKKKRDQSLAKRFNSFRDLIPRYPLDRSVLDEPELR